MPSTTAATARTREPRGRRGAATFALYKASMRRALGIRRSWRQKVAPFVLLGIVTIPAIVNVGIGYVTRDRFFSERIDIITYREYVGVSSALLLFVALVAPDVVCPDRRQHVLPLMFARPITGVDYVLAKLGAIATILFAFSFLPQVVLFVGNMLVSDRRARLLHRSSRRALEGAGRGRAAGRVLRGRRCRDLVAHRPPHRRGLGDHRTLPRHVDRVRRSSSATTTSSKAVRRRGCSTCWRCRCTCATSCSSGTSIRESELNGVAQRRAARNRVVHRGAARRHRSAPPPLPLGGTVTAPHDAASHRANDPAFATDATVTVSNVSVWFRQKVALSELSCSFGPGVTGLLGPNGAGKTTLMRAMTGLIDVNQGTVRIDGSDPRRDRQVFRRLALVPEDEAVPSGLTARQFVRYVADLHGVADRSAPEERPAFGRAAGRGRPPGRRRSARACASARRSRPRSCAIRTCSCSTNR